MINIIFFKRIFSYIICFILIIRLFMKTYSESDKVVGFRISFIYRILILSGILLVTYAYKYFGTDGLFYSSIISLLVCELVPNNPR